MLFGGRRKREIERLLIVEDEPLVAFDTEHFLTDAGFTIVETVDTIAAAIDCIEKGTAIDLVLADVNLADGSGVEVARAAHARGIPVLFVTGNCPGDARALAAGCLAKPYRQRDLIAAIDVIDSVIRGEAAPRKLPGGLSLFARAA